MKKRTIYILLLVTVLFLNANSVMAAGSCVTCGDESLAIPKAVPTFINALVTLGKIIAPLLIIIFGMIRYLRAVFSGDEKVTKEINSAFIRSIIAGVAVFLLVSIVQMAFTFLSNAGGDGSTSCVSCFINGVDNCKEATCPDRNQKGE